MKIFITADHHFHHKNIIEYCKRPFKTVEEMDKVMIEKWNKKVGKDDLVIHLGDFALGTKEQVKETREKLNGTIILIKGNHDKFSEGFIIVENSIRIGNLVFSHRPIPKNEIPKGCINIHGHIHEKESFSGLNVSVEKTDYEPILLEELEKRIEERICRDCGKIIIGRRIDAVICKDCRRKAQEESAQKIKEKEKEERILKKVEISGVKGIIEYNKGY